MNRSKSSRSSQPAEDAAHPTEDDGRARAVIDKLYAMAIRGNVAAAGLFLDRTLGPIPSVQGFSGQIASRIVDPVSAVDTAPQKSETKSASQPRRLLSIKQVAHELGLSGAMVRVLVRKGQITAVRIGRRVLLPVAEVERFVQEQFANLR